MFQDRDDLHADESIQSVDIQHAANRVKSKIESELSKSFRTFQVVEHTMEKEDGKTVYLARVNLDNDGYVCIKIWAKDYRDPETEWNYAIREFATKKRNSQLIY